MSLGRTSSGLKQQFSLWYHTEHMLDTCHLPPCVSADSGIVFHTQRGFQPFSFIWRYHNIRMVGKRGENSAQKPFHVAFFCFGSAFMAEEMGRLHVHCCLGYGLSSSGLPIIGVLEQFHSLLFREHRVKYASCEGNGLIH